MLEEEGGKLVKVAHTMVAKDGEVNRRKCYIVNFCHSAGSLCQPLLPHWTSRGLAEQADGRDEGDDQVTSIVYNSQS